MTGEQLLQVVERERMAWEHAGEKESPVMPAIADDDAKRLDA